MASRGYQRVFNISFEGVETILLHGLYTAQNLYENGSESQRYPIRKDVEAVYEWCQANGVEFRPMASTVERWLNQRGSSKVEGTVYRVQLKTVTKDFNSRAEAEAYANRYNGEVVPIAE